MPGDAVTGRSADPGRAPLGGRTRARRLTLYGLFFAAGTVVLLVLLVGDTFLETGRGRGLFLFAPLVMLVHGVLLIRELLGKQPLTYQRAAGRRR